MKYVNKMFILSYLIKKIMINFIYLIIFLFYIQDKNKNYFYMKKIKMIFEFFI